MKKAFFLLFIIFSCTTPKGLHQSGTYVIESVSNYIVTFKDVSGSYHLPVDTLKVGDTVRMNVIHLARHPRR